MGHRDPYGTLTLLDWRRRTADLYRDVRRQGVGEGAWEVWRAGREHLFREHPQTPVDDPSSWSGLDHFPYDPAWHVSAEIHPVAPATTAVAHSGHGSTRFRRVGVGSATTPGGDVSLDIWWLDAYGGGLFLPFRDATAGSDTYGGGRYLLDTAKGADLGHDGTRLVVDFNFAYHPSCVYSPRWSCPLAPAGNVIEVPVRVGERLPVSSRA